MADKPEFVDLVSAATRQSWRRTVPTQIRARVSEPEPDKPRSRLALWPPARWGEWRMDLVKPWKKRNDPHT